MAKRDLAVEAVTGSVSVISNAGKITQLVEGESLKAGDILATEYQEDASVIVDGQLIELLNSPVVMGSDEDTPLVWPSSTPALTVEIVSNQIELVEVGSPIDFSLMESKDGSLLDSLYEATSALNPDVSLSSSAFTSLLSVRYGTYVLEQLADEIEDHLNENVIVGTSQDEEISGTDADDVVFARQSNDIVYGLAGDDRLYGSQGDDLLSGGEGDDTLYGSEGTDDLQGDAGDDLLYGGNAKDILNGGSGDDLLYGGKGVDFLSGGADNDTLYGDVGNDTLKGDEGDDRLYGGKGNDSMLGGAGEDRLWGDKGNDTLAGGDDNDLIYGGVGNDLVKGDSGDDTLYGSDGNDQVFGNTGADKLYGGDGDDLLDGGQGDDHLNGGSGDDTLLGGDGDDLLLGSSGSDIVYGGSGNNTLTLGSGDNIVVYDGAGNDRVTDFSTRDDKIVVPRSLGFTSLVSLALLQVGADTVLTIGGNTLTLSNVSLDKLTDDHFIFASDDAFAAYTSQVEISLDQTAVVNASQGNFLASGNLLDNEDLVGGWHVSTITLNGAVYELGVGVAVIETERGELTVYGYGDDDHEAGDYVYHVTSEAALDETLDTFELGFANEVGDEMSAELSIQTGVEITDLGDLVDDNALSGFSDNDLLLGDSQDNVLMGYAGDDFIDAELGNDLITGGQGSDDMYGGEGSDTFVFLQSDAALGTVDTIHDFSLSNDSLDLSDILADVASESLDSYLVSLENNEAGEAVLSVATTGEEVDQQITLANLSVSDIAEGLQMTGSSSGQEIINTLIEENILLTSSTF